MTLRKNPGKPIVGFRGYRVDKNGIIWSRWVRGKRRLGDSWRKLNPGKNEDGYLIVCLCIGEKRYFRSIHSLVLEAFVSIRPEGMICRHLDGNPSNNRLDNLAWGTYKENERDKKRHGRIPDRRGSKSPTAKLDDAKVKEIKNWLKMKTYPQYEIARMMKVDPSTISRIATGHRWK